MKVSVVEGILSANDQLAAQNRQLLDQHGICVAFDNGLVEMFERARPA